MPEVMYQVELKNRVGVWFAWGMGPFRSAETARSEGRVACREGSWADMRVVPVPADPAA